jgi:hypothetical protein
MAEAGEGQPLANHAADPLVAHLRRCCLRVMGEKPGCGFVVAPNLLITCAHVVGPKTPVGATLEIRVWGSEEGSLLQMRAEVLANQTTDDLALLRLQSGDYPHVALDGEARMGDQLVAIGFPQEGQRLELDQFTAEFEAEVSFSDGSGQRLTGVELKFKGGQVRHGFSGGPLLNRRTWRVIGIVNATRDARAPNGGWAKRAGAIDAIISAAGHASPPLDQRWIDAEALQRRMVNFVNWFQLENERLKPQFLMELGITQNFLNVQPPINNLWKSFIHRRLWHNELQSLLDMIEEEVSIFTEGSDFTAQIGRLNLSTLVYEEIIISLNPIIQDAIRAVRDILIDLQEKTRIKECQELAHPHTQSLNRARKALNLLHRTQLYLDIPLFQKCFLLSGSIGSGKTHFIFSLLEESINTQDFLILPIEPELYLTHGHNLQDLILKLVEDYTGTKWSSLSEINQCLLQSPRPIDGENKGIKLVLVLDDVQRWLGHDTQILQKLSSIIAYTTKLHAISWLITLPDRCIDTVVSDFKSFWEKYSFVSSINRQIHHRSEHKNRTPKALNHNMIDSRTSNISGWIDLDQLNICSQTGILLIQENLRSRNDQTSLQWLEDHARWITGIVNDDEPRNYRLLRYWANPFIARVILELCLVEGKPIQNFIDLSFTDFVSVYWKIRLNLLDLKTIAQQCSSITSSESVLVAKDIVNTVTHLMAKSFAESGGLALLERDVIKHIQTTVDERPDLFHYLSKEVSQRVIAQSITALLMCGILKETKLNDRQFNVQIRMLNILFEPFWMWRLAEELRLSSVVTEQLEEKASPALTSFFAHINSPELKEAVFEFFLLMLQDKQQPSKLSDRFVYYLWGLGFSFSCFPLAGVWFAASRVDSEIQFVVANLTKLFNSTFSFSNDRHGLFAFMYFIRHSLPTTLSATARLKYLKPHYQAISSTGLSDYYLYTFQQIIQEVKDKEALLQTMKLLAGSEILGFTPALAWVIVERMKVILENKMSLIFGFLITYLRQSGESATAQYRARSKNKNKPKHKWVRTFFREWVLCYTCRFLAEAKPPYVAYQFLDALGWYEAQHSSISSSIASEMEREANIALGYGFHGAENEDRDLFINLISHLVDSSKPKSLEIAFFLMRHTKPTRGQAAVLLDNEFQPFLQRIFLNLHPITNNLAEQYFEMFRLNLADFDELLLKREKLKAESRRKSS